MPALETLRFGELAPDQPDLGNTGSEDIRNVLPTRNGFESMNSLIPYTTDALPSRPLGATTARNIDGAVETIVGTQTELYRLTATNTWQQIGSGFDARTTRWDFCVNRDDLIATNYWDVPQVLQVGAGGSFSPLITSTYKPTGQSCAIVRNYLMLGDTREAGGLEPPDPTQIWWSAYLNPASFNEGQATQSSSQSLIDEGGRIQRIIGGTDAWIFKEASIWLGTFTAGPTFRFDQVARRIGTPAPGSVIKTEGRAFFLSYDGFRMVVPGQETRLIGSERVNRRIMRELDFNHLDRVYAALVTNRDIIAWAYPNQNASNGVPNTLALYNFAEDRWAFADQETQIIFSGATPSYTLEDLDGIFPTVEDVPGSLDDAIWTGGSLEFSAVTRDLKLGFFNGQPLTGTLETGEYQITPGRQTLVQAVKPLVSGNVPQVSLGYRNLQTDPVVWTPYKTANQFGRYLFRHNARFFRARVQTSGEFKDAIGVEVRGAPSGDR